MDAKRGIPLRVQFGVGTPALPEPGQALCPRLDASIVLVINEKQLRGEDFRIGFTAGRTGRPWEKGNIKI